MEHSIIKLPFFHRVKQDLSLAVASYGGGGGGNDPRMLAIGVVAFMFVHRWMRENK